MMAEQSKAGGAGLVPARCDGCRLLDATRHKLEDAEAECVRLREEHADLRSGLPAMGVYDRLRADVTKARAILADNANLREVQRGLVAAKELRKLDGEIRWKAEREGLRSVPEEWFAKSRELSGMVDDALAAAEPAQPTEAKP